MGGICTTASSAVEDRDSQASSRKRLSSLSRRSSSELRVNSSRRHDGIRGSDRLGLHSDEVKAMRIDRKANGSIRVYDDQIEKKRREKSEVSAIEHPGLGRVPKAIHGEQTAAGWPAWLSNVAAEAIKGWIPRRANTFEKLEKIGQGTYSSVYKARDVINDKIVALKKVRFDNLDIESVKFMAREIIILRRLDHPNIIKLEGLITSQMSRSLYLVFEYMEHDLTGLASCPGIKFSEPQVKCYMQQLLSGLDHCHSRGVLHRDIKGSNLLIDDNGILKIADFGLATSYNPHHSVPMTTRVVTLWYRPPELLLGASHYGVAVDLWSTGCILGELYTGKPILPGKTEVEQLHKIFKLCGSPSDDYWRNLRLSHATFFRPPQPYRRCVAETFKDLPAAAMGLIETLLSVDPANRGTAGFALKSEFFTTKPLACDPSTLPKYPPSKEIDAKVRDEVARRQGDVGDKDRKVDLKKRGQKESRAIPGSNADALPFMSMQRRQGQSSFQTKSELFHSHREETHSGLLVAPPKQPRPVKEVRTGEPEHLHKRVSHSGPLVPGPRWTKSEKELDAPSAVSTAVNLSKLSGLVVTRTFSLSDDHQEKPGPTQPDTTEQFGRISGSGSELESRRRQDHKHHSQRNGDFSQIDGKGRTKEPSLHGHGSRGSKIYVSGPLLNSSNNVDQMLKEHDRKIQEFSRRARLDKTRVDQKVHSRGRQVTAN
ncbi:probable serine/threonine-protein kinase At1g54610 [Corylus avellana]|uniref:probable serine/threonine-protein kinase At1g54610 n=1 Tax=Corylus avellana TaxID=13451 RepID=UPI001E22801B|nr:probable serine/threonine-protein kinase At1g54610 [Corylus avellana]XP_059449375.1 probable serine/threonine-protein kinase At1g54610 [Corylus avellana]